jgi:Myb/SANT-like DNA-binding domain
MVLLEAHWQRLSPLICLGKKNLCPDDWEYMANYVNNNNTGKSKTVAQCKNRIRALRVQYQVECDRLFFDGIARNWPYFNKVECFVSATSTAVSPFSVPQIAPS